ncbi:MAG TPA: hypothetical protein VEG30_03680 [Terriglobales bacterium]|nr:hypothetical protein [Terriglobales bacterium]
MRRVQITCTLMASLLLVAMSVLAADKNTANVTISDAVTVGSSQLAPGDYKLSWEGAGPEVQVTFTRGKTSVTAPATITDQTNSYGRTAVIVKQENGSKVLTSIQLPKRQLILEGEQTQAGR